MFQLFKSPVGLACLALILVGVAWLVVGNDATPPWGDPTGIVRRNPELDLAAPIATFGEHTITVGQWLGHLYSQFAEEGTIFHEFGLNMGALTFFWDTPMYDGRYYREFILDHTNERMLTEANHLLLMALLDIQVPAEPLAAQREGISERLVAAAGETLFEQHQYFYDTHMLPYELYQDVRDRSLTSSMFLAGLQNTQTFTQAALQAYIDTHLSTIEGVAGATIAHILLAHDSAPFEVLVEQAEALMARVEAGEDIAVLAQVYSDDIGIRRPSGAFYTFDREEMVYGIESWAFSHQAGDRGLVMSEFGAHVIEHFGFEHLYEPAETAYRAYLAQAWIEEQLAAFNVHWDIDHDALATMAHDIVHVEAEAP